MKTYNHLYENVISEETRKQAINDVSKDRNKIKDFNTTVEKSLRWIENYRPVKHKPIIIHDGISKKKRTIIVPTFEELTVQHAVVTAMMPVFTKGMYEHSYASIPGRGIHKAKKYIEKWIKHDPRNVKYILKMDIRHFFDSIPHYKLKELILKKIRDIKMIDLLFKIIDTTEKGLPLGFTHLNGLRIGILNA